MLSYGSFPDYPNSTNRGDPLHESLMDEPPLADATASSDRSTGTGGGSGGSGDPTGPEPSTTRTVPHYPSPSSHSNGDSDGDGNGEHLGSGGDGADNHYGLLSDESGEAAAVDTGDELNLSVTVTTAPTSPGGTPRLLGRPGVSAGGASPRDASVLDLTCTSSELDLTAPTREASAPASDADDDNASDRPVRHHDDPYETHHDVEGSNQDDGEGDRSHQHYGSPHPDADEDDGSEGEATASHTFVTSSSGTMEPVDRLAWSSGNPSDPLVRARQLIAGLVRGSVGRAAATMAVAPSQVDIRLPSLRPADDSEPFSIEELTSIVQQFGLSPSGSASSSRRSSHASGSVGTRTPVLTQRSMVSDLTPESTDDDDGGHGSPSVESPESLSPPLSQAPSPPTPTPPSSSPTPPPRTRPSSAPLHAPILHAVEQWRTHGSPLSSGRSHATTATATATAAGTSTTPGRSARGASASASAMSTQRSHGPGSSRSMLWDQLPHFRLWGGDSDSSLGSARPPSRGSKLSFANIVIPIPDEAIWPLSPQSTTVGEGTPPDTARTASQEEGEEEGVAERPPPHPSESAPSPKLPARARARVTLVESVQSASAPRRSATSSMRPSSAPAHPPSAPTPAPPSPMAARPVSAFRTRGSKTPSSHHFDVEEQEVVSRKQRLEQAFRRTNLIRQRMHHVNHVCQNPATCKVASCGSGTATTTTATPSGHGTGTSHRERPRSALSRCSTPETARTPTAVAAAAGARPVTAQRTRATRRADTDPSEDDSGTTAAMMIIAPAPRVAQHALFGSAGPYG